MGRAEAAAAMCVCARERAGEREAVKEKMGGSITHPDWEEERTDIVPPTDRGGREVGMRDRRGGAKRSTMKECHPGNAAFSPSAGGE